MHRVHYLRILGSFFSDGSVYIRRLCGSGARSHYRHERQKRKDNSDQLIVFHIRYLKKERWRNARVFYFCGFRLLFNNRVNTLTSAKWFRKMNDFFVQTAVCITIADADLG